MSPLINEGTDLAGAIANGQTVVNAGSPLTRLNYFDGKFLRADDLKREQSYLRQLVQFSNQGLGAGVVYGLDTELDRQGRLSIGAGLAMDSSGRTLLVGSNATLDIASLIDASRRITTRAKTNGKTILSGNAGFADCVDVTSAPGDTVGVAGSLYVICIGHAESLCGTEDVYGRLCEDACVTATDRPLIVEGVVVRALPLTLRTPLATSKAVALASAHLRSLVASAFFEDERHVVQSLISRAGLSSDVWCAGAELTAVGCVPLAVVGRAGLRTTFLDAWTVRRERMEAPSKRYWAWRMAMRPWDVYLAHILQFQCQLHEVLGGDTDGGGKDPCGPQQQALNDASKYLRDFNDSYTRHIEALSKITEVPDAFRSNDALFRLQGGAADLAKLRLNIDGALKNIISAPKSRVLINGGIVELPSAGYLPVVPGTVTVNEQVRRLLGEGLDLRFCIVRPDFVPHALEEAQHMERISLLTGLDDPQSKPEVDILVPNGDLQGTISPSLAGFDTQVTLLPSAAGSLVGAGAAGVAKNNIAVSAARSLNVHGAGRADTSTGAAFHFAGAQEVESAEHVIVLANSVKEFVGASAKKREMILRAAMETTTAAKPAARAALPASELISNVSLRPGLSALRGNAVPKPVVGVWTTMRTERDPFALRVADSTPVSLEFALTSQSNNADGVVTHTMIRVRAFATFSVTQAALAVAGGTRMTGHMSGTYTTQLFVESNTPTDTTKPFDVEVTLLRTGTAASGKLHAHVGNADSAFQWIGDASWGGAELEATLELSMLLNAKSPEAGLPKPLPVLSASAFPSSNALAEGNVLRVLSTAALGILGEELTRANQNGTAFVDVADRLLFPPPPPPVDDLTVRPTLDWVLFHRRRTKHCATVVTPPAPTPPRRYQLLTIRAKDLRTVQLIKQALRGESNSTPVFQYVDVLEFASGSATLVTPSDALLQDWGGAQPGNTLVYAAAATSITTDSDLTMPRLERVVRAVAPISTLDPNFDAVEVLAKVPVALDIPGTDGIVVLLTVQRTTCQEVYRVELNDDTASMLQNDQLKRLLSLESLTKRLGTVHFDALGAVPDPTDLSALAAAWKAVGAGTPSSSKVYADPNDAAASTDPLLVPRAKSLLVPLGGTSTQSVSAGNAVAAEWPPNATCPAVVFLGATLPFQVLAVAWRVFTQVTTHVVPPQRIPLAGDVLSFHDATLDDASVATTVGTAVALTAAAIPGVRSIGISYLTPGAVDDLAKKRLDALVAAMAIQSTAFQVQNLGVRAIATDAEKQLLTGSGQNFGALLVIVVNV